MRKSIVAFFLLIVVCGAVFFIGWVQFAVPAGAYGVLSSKTGGINKEVLSNGRFRWAWERLLPTNTTMMIFSIDPVERSISVSGILPSADVYARMIGGSVDFSYEVEGNIFFSVKPDTLPVLAIESAVSDQAALDAWEERTAGSISDFVARRLRAYAEDAEELDRIIASGSTPRLISDIERAFPQVESVSCAIKIAKFPDLALYRSAKELYQVYLDHRKALLSTSASDAASSSVKSRLRIDELEGYGELLTKYPILLKYLAIEAGANADTVNLLKALGE